MADRHAKHGRTTEPVRVVIGTGRRETRAALFVAVTSAPTVKLVAAASTLAELATYVRSFRPDAVIVADDLAETPTFDNTIDALATTAPRAQILVVGPTVNTLPANQHVTPVAESTDIIDTLFEPATNTRD